MPLFNPIMDPITYVTSRGQNLISNGTGLLGNIYNFPGFTFDSVETYAGAGSFKANLSGSGLYTSELMPVDTASYYRLGCWAKAGDVGGGNFNAANIQYVGIVSYDIDRVVIQPEFNTKASGSADTTLSAQLNVGATTISLTSSTGWYNGASGYARNLAWWPYTNAKGYTYPDYTYSQHATSFILNDNYANGLWANGGISGTTITLRATWPGPQLANGTKVANYIPSNTFKYITMSATSVPNAWTKYEGYIGSLDTSRANNQNQFGYGMAFAGVVFLVNYHGVADNNIRYSAVNFTEQFPIIQDEGVVVIPRNTLNMVGAGVTSTDSAANFRTTITIP